MVFHFVAGRSRLYLAERTSSSSYQTADNCAARNNRCAKQRRFQTSVAASSNLNLFGASLKFG